MPSSIERKILKIDLRKINAGAGIHSSVTDAALVGALPTVNIYQLIRVLRSASCRGLGFRNALQSFTD